MIETNGFRDAVEFLLFSYFAVDFDDKSDDKTAGNSMINRAIDKAFFDATMQNAYNGLEKKNHKKEMSEKAKQKLINAISELSKCNVKSFDKWHKDLCCSLKNEYSGVTYIDKYKGEINAFSFGNAQKWVNMTMKYIYLLYHIYSEFMPDCEFCEQYKSMIEKYQNKFHVPVDRYIIESVWRNENVCLPKKEEDKELNRGRDYVNPADYVLPWSKWENADDCKNCNGCMESQKCDYGKFQKSLRENLPDNSECLLQWEAKAWIDTVKSKRK